MHSCMHVHWYVHVCTHILMYIGIFNEHMYAYIYERMYVFTQVDEPTFACAHVSMYVWIYDYDHTHFNARTWHSVISGILMAANYKKKIFIHTALPYVQRISITTIIFDIFWRYSTSAWCTKSIIHMIVRFFITSRNGSNTNIEYISYLA